MPRYREAILKKLMLWIVVLLVLCVAAGAAYNAVSVWLLMKQYPVPGKFYQVNGVSMHLYCTGAGSPTVVLETGLGNDWIGWQKVQPELSKTTHVCSYDRAGIGWSDSRPGLRDSKNIAAELHALLQQAGETGPFVLVGASSGGLHVREFTATYPAEIAGLVFVDGSSPEQIEVLPGAKYSDANAKRLHRQVTWAWIKEAFGWARLTGHCKGGVGSGLEAYADLERANDCRPSRETGSLAEWDYFWRAAEEVAHVSCCGDLPILVISQDPDRPKAGMSAQVIANQPIWNGLQENLKRLSPHSRRIIARGSRHPVMIDRPDVVISGTQRLIMEIRNKTTDPEEGTTVVQ